MRAINLLPPEAFEKQKSRRRWIKIIVVFAAYIALLAVATVFFNGRVSSAEDKVAAQQASNDQLRAEVNRLGTARDLETRYLNNISLVEASLQSDVSWGRILNDLGRLIPDSTWLESFSGASSPDTALPGTIGTLQMSVIGFDFPDVSAWLRSLDSDRFPSVSGTWVTQASQTQIGEADVVAFATSTALTSAAESGRLDERVPRVGE